VVRNTMTKQKITTIVYWDDGTVIGHKTVWIYPGTPNEGHLSDGRPVKKINGKWIFKLDAPDKK